MVTGKDVVLHACRQLDTKMTVVYVEVDEHVSDSRKFIYSSAG